MYVYFKELLRKFSDECRCKEKVDIECQILCGGGIWSNVQMVWVGFIDTIFIWIDFKTASKFSK